jgi:hypothetical protein
VKERAMTGTRIKKRLVYSTEEFKRVYLPEIDRSGEIPSENKPTEFGVDLVRKIMSRIDRKT